MTLKIREQSTLRRSALARAEDLCPAPSRDEPGDGPWKPDSPTNLKTAVAVYIEGVEGWQGFVTLTFCPRVGVGSLWLPRGSQVLRYRQTQSGQEEPFPVTSVPFVQRVLARFRHLLNVRYYGQHYRRSRLVDVFSSGELAVLLRSGRVRFYEVLETQKRGALHAHQLIGGLPKGWRYTDIHEVWKAAQEAYGLVPGRAWVVPYPKKNDARGRENLTSYVAKYVSKDVSAELWNLYGFGSRIDRWQDWMANRPAAGKAIPAENAPRADVKSSRTRAEGKQRVELVELQGSWSGTQAS